MQFRNSIYLFLIFVLGFCGPVIGQTQKANLSDIEKSLVCLCGCNLTLEACQASMSCETSEKLKNEAAGYLQKGMNKDDVIAAFVNEYGEQILATPSQKTLLGKLAYWLIPISMVFGLAIVVVSLKHLTGKKHALPEQKAEEPVEVGKEAPVSDLDDLVERELEELD